MRPTIRIYKYLNLFLNNLDKTDLNKSEIEIINDNKETIFKYWKTYPDQRLTQMLFNLFNFKSYKDSNYYIEDFQYLYSLDIPANELLLWGSRGINGDEELRYMFLKDLETSHIENILRTQKNNLSSIYVVELKKELDKRTDKTIIEKSIYGDVKLPMRILTESNQKDITEFIKLTNSMKIDILVDSEYNIKNDFMYIHIHNNITVDNLIELMKTDFVFEETEKYYFKVR